jgi:hypothetical protein
MHTAMVEEKKTKSQTLSFVSHPLNYFSLSRSQLFSYIHTIEDKTLYLEENIYLNIHSICGEVKKHMTFQE